MNTFHVLTAAHDSKGLDNPTAPTATKVHKFAKLRKQQQQQQQQTSPTRRARRGAEMAETSRNHDSSTSMVTFRDGHDADSPTESGMIHPIGGIDALKGINLTAKGYDCRSTRFQDKEEQQPQHSKNQQQTKMTKSQLVSTS